MTLRADRYCRSLTLRRKHLCIELMRLPLAFGMLVPVLHCLHVVCRPHDTR